MCLILIILRLYVFLFVVFDYLYWFMLGILVCNLCFLGLFVRFFLVSSFMGLLCSFIVLRLVLSFRPMQLSLSCLIQFCLLYGPFSLFSSLLVFFFIVSWLLMLRCLLSFISFLGTGFRFCLICCLILLFVDGHLISDRFV